MKNLTILLIPIILILFFACSKEEENTSKNKILGTWKRTYVRVDTPLDGCGYKQGVKEQDPYPVSYKFRENGNYTITNVNSGASRTGEYSVTDDIITFKDIGGETDYYFLDGDLIMTSIDNSIVQSCNGEYTYATIVDFYVKQ